MIRFILSVLTLGLYPLLTTSPRSKSQVGKIRRCQFHWMIEEYGTPTRKQFQKLCEQYFSKEESELMTNGRHFPVQFIFSAPEATKMFEEDASKLGLEILKSHTNPTSCLYVEHRGSYYDIFNPDWAVCENCNKMVDIKYDSDEDRYICRECWDYSGVDILNREYSEKEMLQYAKKFQKFIEKDERFNCESTSGSEIWFHTG